MPKDKVGLNDIVGMVKTDETTNSVELKKEAYNPKLFTLEANGRISVLGKELSDTEVVTLLNNFNHENNMMNSRLRFVEKILKRYFKTYLELGYPFDFSSRDKYIEGYLKGQRDVMKELKEEIDKL